MALDYGMILNQPSAASQIQQGIGSFMQIREMDAQAKMREQAQAAAAAQAERQGMFQQAFGQAFQSGDRKQLAALMGDFPDQYEQIKGALGFQDEQKATALGSLGVQLSQFAATDPQAAANLIVQNADVLRSAGPGYEPEALLQTLQQDPAALADRADKFSLLALGPEKYFDVTGARDKINAQMRGQDIQIRGQDIQQQEGQANRANAMSLKQLTLADKALDRQVSMLGKQLGNETNELRRQELALKLEEKRGQLESAKRDKEVAGKGALATFDRAIDTIDEIKNSSGFSAAVGVPGPSSYLPGTAAKETQGLIESLKSQAFLAEVEKMKGLGALTEREGAALTSAVGSLQLDMPEAAFKRSLDRIEDYFRAGKSRISEKYNVQPEQQPTIRNSAAAPQGAQSGGWEIVQ
jgi:hypothetical protein